MMNEPNWTRDPETRIEEYDITIAFYTEDNDHIEVPVNYTITDGWEIEATYTDIPGIDDYEHLTYLIREWMCKKHLTPEITIQKK